MRLILLPPRKRKVSFEDNMPEKRQKMDPEEEEKPGQESDLSMASAFGEAFKKAFMK